MNDHPLIGVTGPDRGGWPMWVWTWLAIERAGGRARRLTPNRYPDHRPLPRLDGLILGGGADVDPARYGEQLKSHLQHKDPPAAKSLRGRLLSRFLAPLILLIRLIFALKSTGVDHRRDAFEHRCLQQALDTGISILGICRGAQFINIHLGGTLHTEIGGFYGESGKIRTAYPRNPIHIKPSSRLQQILGTDHTFVNSLHDQAVKSLGDGLVVTARDEGNVIQAIEHTTHPYLIGVQWHPEFLPSIHLQQRLFRALIEQARNSASPSHLNV